MKKAVTVTIVCAALITQLTYLTPSYSAQSFEDKMMSVSLGMTKAEALGILGKPSSALRPSLNYQGNVVEVLQYYIVVNDQVDLSYLVTIQDDVVHEISRRPGNFLDADVATYMVYMEGRPVLQVIDRSGPLTSTAIPTPGTSPVLHPFLTASALDPMEESRLRSILNASENTLEFLDALRLAGYEVQN